MASIPKRVARVGITYDLGMDDPEPVTKSQLPISRQSKDGSMLYCPIDTGDMQQLIGYR